MSHKNKIKNIPAETQKINVLSIILIATVIVLVLATLIFNSGAFKDLFAKEKIIDLSTGLVVTSAAQLDASIIENQNIAYPGYEKITFVAGNRKQNVLLTNPRENTCFFQISITLDDGTLLWKSDYLNPGCAFEQIVLNKTMPSGTYENATLQYESFSKKDGRKLNGSSVKLTIQFN